MVFVAVVWGGTNPLIGRFGKGIEHCHGLPEKLYFLVKSPLFLLSILGMILIHSKSLKVLMNMQNICHIPLGNQLGSILFYILLNSTELSIAVPIVNSLTMLFTALFGIMLGESRLGAKGYFGLLLIVIGTCLCNIKR